MREIDVRHMGRERVICCYELGDGVIIDPGPQSSEDTLIEALGGEARARSCSPISTSTTPAPPARSCAAGRTRRLRPRARRPAPARPVEAVGEREPALAGRHGRALGRGRPGPGGEHQPRRRGRLVFGMRVAYTPRHASHHVSYLHEDSGYAFVGDVAGVRVPPVNHTLMPTPPPDIDVEAWLESMRSWSRGRHARSRSPTSARRTTSWPRSTRPATSCASGPASPATRTKTSSSALPRGPRGAHRRRVRARLDRPGERPAARLRRPRSLLGSSATSATRAERLSPGAPAGLRSSSRPRTSGSRPSRTPPSLGRLGGGSYQTIAWAVCSVRRRDLRPSVPRITAHRRRGGRARPPTDSMDSRAAIVITFVRRVARDGRT